MGKPKGLAAWPNLKQNRAAVPILVSRTGSQSLVETGAQPLKRLSALVGEPRPQLGVVASSPGEAWTEQPFKPKLSMAAISERGASWGHDCNEHLLLVWKRRP